jgi:hypothetical protein
MTAQFRLLNRVVRVCVIGAVAGALPAGCSKEPDRPEVVPVSGTVTYKDQPVEGAVVAFRGDGQSKSATGITDANGRFQLTSYEEGDGAPAGQHVITVTKVATQAPDTSDTSMEAAAERLANPTPEVKPEAPPIPAKYADPDRSGLQETVQSGQPNDFKIELTD